MCWCFPYEEVVLEEPPKKKEKKKEEQKVVLVSSAFSAQPVMVSKDFFGEERCVLNSLLPDCQICSQSPAPFISYPSSQSTLP